MKGKLNRLSVRYASALQKYLEQGARAGLLPAGRLGRQAVSLGLETLDIARIHEAALATLRPSDRQDSRLKRAEVFFSEAVIPIEKTHGAARKAEAHLNQVNKALDRRTVELAVSHQSLRQSIIRRETVEAALKKSGGHSEKLLEESRCLQEHLRHLTHKILDAQEDKRKKISRELQDEIAQTLLGINVRLLSLKKEAAASARNFEKDIASTQRLVNKAGKNLNQFAREIGKRYET